MAKAKTTTKGGRWAGKTGPKKTATRKTAGKTARPIAEPIAEPAPEPEPPAVARARLLSEIREACDAMDANIKVRQAKGGASEFLYPSYNSPHYAARAAMREAVRDFLNLVDPEDDGLGTEQLMDELTVAPGEVPSWARPGTFLIWVGYVPIRCIWGGYAMHIVDLVAADPAAMWIDPSGSRSTGAMATIPATDATPADWLRRHVTLITQRQDFDLFTLTPWAREATRQELEQPRNAWLAPALARGPIDPVPLPRKLAAVQQRLFG